MVFRNRHRKMPDTTSAEEGKGQKREAEESSSDSDDDFVGPSITDAAPVKKKRVLQYEKVYLGRWYSFSSVEFFDFAVWSLFLTTWNRIQSLRYCLPWGWDLLLPDRNVWKYLFGYIRILGRYLASCSYVTNHCFYLENLPSGENYEKSFMHRDVVTHVMVTPTDFIITASCDGHIKFWKKLEASAILFSLNYYYLKYFKLSRNIYRF